MSKTPQAPQQAPQPVTNDPQPTAAEMAERELDEFRRVYNRLAQDSRLNLQPWRDSDQALWNQWILARLASGDYEWSARNLSMFILGRLLDVVFLDGEGSPRDLDDRQLRALVDLALDPVDPKRHRGTALAAVRRADMDRI